MSHKIFLLVLSFLFMVFDSHGEDENKSNSQKFSTQDKLITLLLEETDNVRTSHQNRYVKNLEKLSKLKSQFNGFQAEFYEYLIASGLAYKGEFEGAIKQLHVLFGRSMDVRIKIRIKGTLSNIYALAGDYEKAIDNLDYVIEHVDVIEDKKSKHLAYNLSSIVYRLVDQNELSLNFSELLIQDNPSHIDLCKGLYNKYRIVLGSSLRGDIGKEVQDAINICELADEYIYSNSLKLEWVKFKLTMFDDDKNKVVSVLEELKQIEIAIEDINYKNLTGFKNSMFAKAYALLGMSELSVNYAELTLRGSESLGVTEQKIEALGILVDYHKSMGDYQSAIKYLLELNRSEKNTYDKQQAKSMAYQTVKHENLAKSHEIEFLNQKNRMLSLEQKLGEETALNQRLLILFLILFASLIFFWGYKTKMAQLNYKDLSELDHMTKIYNRKGIEDYVKNLIRYSEQKKQSFSFAIMDLDFFKKVNDDYGHITGDWVIQNVIKVCEQQENDKVSYGRLGGEEFGIVMRNSDMNEMVAFAEQCRIAITKMDTSDSYHDLKITASFGVTSTDHSGYVYTSLLSHADVALYKAKSGGRNQVVAYQAS